MLQFFRYVLLPCVILPPICAGNDYRKLFLRDDIVDDAEAIFSCVNFTAVRLFNDGNRIGVICYECGRLENEIIRMFMKNQAIVVSNRPLPIKKRRSVSYVVFASKTFADSRLGLLKKGMNLHNVQYLFVSTAKEDAVVAFAGDLWHEGFRDIAFLTLNTSLARGIVQVPKSMEGTITLKSVGYCSSSGDSLNEILPYDSNFYRFCAKKQCTLLFGSVIDETVQFWRQEDRLKLSETIGYQSMGSMLIDRFTSFYNIVPLSVKDDLSWPRAAEKLINGELDMEIAVTPEDIEILEGLEIVSLYRYRTLMFAAQVRLQVRNYPVLQLLTPLHYTVWLCAIVTLIAYVLLLYTLRKLADMGLIKERLNLIQIYEIMLGQNTSFPQKTSLRAILALWMIFSLNMNIIYNSTFTSSLADSDTEDLAKNLKEVRDAGIPIIGPPIVQDFLNDSDDPVIADLSDRYRVMTRANETFDEILSKDDIMGVVQQITVDRMNWATRMDRKLRIYTLSQPVLTYPVLFYTRADHPYRTPFQRIVTEYQQSGLLYKWDKYYVIDEDKQLATSHEKAQDNSGILTMEHLGPVFKLFFMCQAISVLIFFVELFKFHVPQMQ